VKKALLDQNLTDKDIEKILYLSNARDKITQNAIWVPKTKTQHAKILRTLASIEKEFQKIMDSNKK